MRFDPKADHARYSEFPIAAARIRTPSRHRDPSMQLLDAVMRLAGPHAELIRHAERPWASATFQGSRHTITLSFAGDEAVRAGETFIAVLPDHEFTITRQLVADAVVSEVRHDMVPHQCLTLEAEVLLLEDC